MELEAFSNLYKRIQTDPSILFLGQNYLFAGMGEDPIWEKIITEFYPDLKLSSQKADYPKLWKEAVKNSTDAQTLLEQIIEIGKNIPADPALKHFLNLKWSLLYTSAIGGLNVLWWLNDRGYSPVPYDVKNATHTYMDKNRRWCVELCGNLERPPFFQGLMGEKKFFSNISNQISWISNVYLAYYGVLIIDGLDINYDWVNDAIFEKLLTLPPQSVFWFSAPENLSENARLLADEGILTVDSESFCSHIKRHMPELLEELDSWSEKDARLYSSLTLFHGKKSHTIQLLRSEISSITGENLCFIDDDCLQDSVVDTDNRVKNFAEFLMQNRIPQWRLFLEKPSFYVSRDKDENLKNEVQQALKKDTKEVRKPVILCGPSNSGKSMMLANLALNFAKERKHPVIYIRGDFLAGAEKRLKIFIDSYLNNIEIFDEDRPERTLVIWDGGGLNRTEQDYIALQKLLFNCNALVVGSLYVAGTSNIRLVQVEQAFSNREWNHLREVLSSINGCYLERLNRIKYLQENRKIKNSSLLYWLQVIFKYEFDDEYKELKEILHRQFNQEKIFAEDRTNLGLKQYVNEIVNAEEIRSKRGFASSFQAQLQFIYDQIKAKKIDEELTDKSQLETIKNLSSCVETINKFLAVASQFGIFLPLTLLLKTLKNEGTHYISYGEDAYKLVDVLRNDTLVDFYSMSHPVLGENVYVRFRNAIEAEHYISSMCNLSSHEHEKKRTDLEVQILMDIINHAENDAERWRVNELVRQFGPNGHGMLSELEEMKTYKDYLSYQEYWLQIANALIQAFPDDPESVILYAHLIREYVSKSDEKSNYNKDYADARARLKQMLVMIDNGKVYATELQRDRLNIELCANYQQTLRTEFNETFYADIKKIIRRVFNRIKIRNSDNNELSSNSLLDILLNAYFEFRKACDTVESKIETEKELVDILSDIDQMLNFDLLDYDKNAVSLLNKIRGIYSLLENKDLLERLEAEFNRKRSDVFLYLQARLIWQKDMNIKFEDDNLNFFAKDRYMMICRDFLYKKTEIPEVLISQAQKDAQEVISFFEREDSAKKIQETQSARCIAMLLRAKWILQTGKPILAEKQSVALRREDLYKFYELCQQYITYCASGIYQHEQFIPAYFLSGVYNWIYGDIKKAKEFFGIAKDYCDEQTRSVERLTLCVEGTCIPRTFIVSVQQQESKKYTAKILKETTQMQLQEKDLVLERYGMIVPDTVLRILFNGKLPTEKQERAQQEAIIRFNLIGAIIGPVSGGGVLNGK